MTERSAGVLLFRLRDARIEILLVHPGGPFWARKDDGAWSIPKGLYEDSEDPQAAARREFAEETGSPFEGELTALGEFKLPSGKLLSVWVGEGDMDVTTLRSNLFEMEWPPRSGKRAKYPEVDRADWFAPEAVRVKLTKGQLQVLDAFLARPLR